MATRRTGFFIAMVLCAIVSAPVIAQGLAAVGWYTPNPGGQAAGGVYGLAGAAGQPEAGQAAGGVYGLTGGFYGPVLVTPTPTPPPWVGAAGPAAVSRSITWGGLANGLAAAAAGCLLCLRLAWRLSARRPRPGLRRPPPPPAAQR